MLKTYKDTHIANEVIDKITGTLPEYQSKVRDLSCAERVRLISKFIKLRSDLRKVAEENGIESLNKILLYLEKREARPRGGELGLSFTGAPSEPFE